MVEESPYEVLGVPQDADMEAIKAAYRALAAIWHPDRNKDPQAETNFKRAREAYETLKDDESRAHFDRTGTRAEPSPDGEAREALIGICLMWAQQGEYTHDFKQIAYLNINNQLGIAAKNVAGFKSLIDKIGKKVKRLTRKSEGTNFLVIAMENRMQELTADLKREARKEKVYKRATEMVEDFEYDFAAELHTAPLALGMRRIWIAHNPGV